MADLNAAKQIKTRASSYASYPIADGVTLYQGALVSLEGGYLNHWADGANDVFVGIVVGEGDGISPGSAITGNTSGTPVPQARVDQSGVTLVGLDSVGGSPTAATVGDLVYGSTSNTDDLTLDATGRTHPIGYMSAYRSATDVDVTLFTPSVMLAQATA